MTATQPNRYATTSPREAAREMEQIPSLLIDVRTKSEYDQGHAENALNIPLNELQNRLNEIPSNSPVYVICRSGKRSAEACRWLADHGYHALTTIEGGTKAWSTAGLPMSPMPPGSFSMERQIRVVAGLLTLGGVLGSLFYSPLIWLSGFVGAGLIFAGITDTCGLAYLLRFLPWNLQRDCNSGDCCR